ncbi:alpha,alpha-phosphotrehalase [Latilactobacillus sakei]|uniref:alpha,alpha-phosphotrehalase n=1 Tax=Latilactobacillus sakei TaxID=1599 RepID=UPI0020748950|nr:alpha,alpha-phosphotrehalase [Latilactobacillus sakei]USG08148.1 alpha,alpha-phosphotrehalase [Latilactobacillus sakei]USG11825.1 alpha,alpha-phosphotrehalase [Latilactobacillus sakei]
MKWWQKATVYQIYPRSFQDSNGDGIGDIKGIIQRLDYLQDLGIELIWLTPMYVSPGRDNGYDIADYYQIDPIFGDLADFERLLKEAHQRGIKIMMDMVVNHTSDQHRWFQESLKGKDNPYHDYYLWRDPVDGHEPNNWLSKFSGSAWEYVPALDQYYLHLYEKRMPDLNWRNPQLREEIYQMMQFWADLGIDGLRLDVINNISKDKEFPNDTFATPSDDGRNFYTNGPHVHEYIHEMYERVFGPNNFVTVGELSSTPVSEAIRYTNPEREELSMAFTFHHVKVDYTGGKKWTLGQYCLSDLKRILSQWQTEMAAGGGWNALFWSNHDQPRAISRFLDDGQYRDQSAKLLALVEFWLQGTPYIYQGEEIAMKNANFTSIDQYQDAESINAYHQMLADGISEDLAIKILQQKSRENCRIPMQWDMTANHGFTTGMPWLQPVVADDYSVATKAQAPDSVFAFYQQLVALRKTEPVLIEGQYQLLAPEDEAVYTYQRQLGDKKVRVIANFTDQTQQRANAAVKAVMMSNYPDQQLTTDQITLRPYEAVMLEIE